MTSNWELVKKIKLDREGGNGMWARVTAADGKAHVYVVLRPEGLHDTRTSIWLVNTMADAHHISKFGGKRYAYAEVAETLSLAQALALKLAEKALRRKRPRYAAAAAPPPGSAAAGVAPAGAALALLPAVPAPPVLQPAHLPAVAPLAILPAPPPAMLPVAAPPMLLPTPPVAATQLVQLPVLPPTSAAAPPPPSELARLRSMLAAESARADANAQLADRATKCLEAERVSRAAARNDAEALRAKLTALESDYQRLRHAMRIALDGQAGTSADK